MRISSFIRNIHGFTLIEILVVIGMIAVLASVVLVAINPLRQFAQARNAQRASDVNAILNAIGERIAENRGVFTGGGCPASLPHTATVIASTGGYDLRPCIVPDFISELPIDPTDGRNTCTQSSCAVGQSYDSAYSVMQDESTNRITICAPKAAESAISGAVAYCLTR